MGVPLLSAPLRWLKCRCAGRSLSSGVLQLLPQCAPLWKNSKNSRARSRMPCSFPFLPRFSSSWSSSCSLPACKKKWDYIIISLQNIH